MKDVMLRTEGIKKYFDTKSGKLHAVEDISIAIRKGKTLGVVGESGCGKSTLGRTILRLVEPTSGKIYYRDEDITKLPLSKMRRYRKKMQMIFQDPYSSLNPRLSVKSLILEPMRIHSDTFSKSERDTRLDELMSLVDLNRDLADVFPHELDGGRRQRIGIARALSLNPEVIICDEPVSALDVSIQAQILNLLMDLQETMNLTYMFISHNLSVVKHISDEIMVMYLGECVEKTTSSELFRNPLHPYTQALLSAIPKIRGKDVRGKRELITGEVTSPINPPIGCRFANRCKYYKPECTEKKVSLKMVATDHYVACTRYD